MENSRTENSIRNIFFGLLFNILTILLGFVNRNFFIKYLNVDYLGMRAIFENISLVFSLIETGFATSLAVTLYKPIRENDYKTITNLTYYYKKIYLILTVCIFSIQLILMPFLNILIKTSINSSDVKYYYCIFILNSSILCYFTYKSIVISANQKEYLLKKCEIIIYILQSILSIIALVYTKSYNIYLIIQLLCMILKKIIFVYMANKYFPYIKNKPTKSSFEFKTIFRNAMSVYIYKISEVLFTTLDVFLMSFFMNTNIVGIYSNYTLIIEKVKNLINVCFYSLTASLGNLIKQNNKKEQYDIFLTLQLISHILSIILIPQIVLLINDFIKIWLNGDYILNSSVVLAISLNFYIGLLQLPTYVFRDAIGLYKEFKMMMFISFILNAVLSLILFQKIGLLGLFIATIMAKMFTTFWYEPLYLIKNHLKNIDYTFFVNELKNILYVSILFVINKFISVNIIVNNFYEWVFKALLLTILSVVYAYVLYRKSKYLKVLYDKLHHLLKNTH